MLKGKGVYFLLAVLCFMAVGLPACNCGDGEKKTTVQLPPSAGAEQQSKPVSQYSFEAATYTNESPAFTVSYPKSWVIRKPAEDIVFSAGSSPDATADGLIVTVVNETVDITGSAKTLLEESSLLKKFGAMVDIVSSKEILLSDGKTKAYELEMVTSIAGYKFTIYGVGASKSGKTVYVSCFTMKGEKSKALLQEITRTLSFK